MGCGVCLISHCWILRSGTAALRLGAVAVMGPGTFFLLTSGSAVLPRVVFAHVGAGRVVCVFVRDGCFISDEVVECHCLEPGCGVMELCIRPLDGSPPPYDGGVRR